MINKNSFHKILFQLFVLSVFIGVGCKKRDVSGLTTPTYPVIADVFIDDFTGDLGYGAFGGSDLKAFQIDTKETYNNTRQSMRFEVPDANSPNGSYAGGVFLSKSGRDLSGFNALTFYIKANQAETIGELGFGNSFGENKYVVNITNVSVNSNWKKVIIPIPDASKLVGERGLFYYAAGPDANGKGFTFWVDEVKFENLGTITNSKGQIFLGQNRTITNAENGDIINVDGISYSITLPTGVNQSANISTSYFNFTSSNPSVATVDSKGAITVIAAGTTTITAKLGNNTVAGSLALTSVGAPVLPATPAPTPTRPSANVISLYSNAYSNVPVNTWNTYWQFSTATNTFTKVAGDDVIRYKNLNFVGIEFTNPTINVTSMRYFHIDLWTPDATTAPNNFKIKLVDFGGNNAYGGGDDKEGEITVSNPTLVTRNWISLDIPLSQFAAAGLTTRANLAQMVFSGTVPNMFVDNVYFYTLPTAPTTAAPTPTIGAANVLSIFSDAYTNVAGTDFNPNWGQSTVTTQTAVAGNNTLRYAGLNYQGTQFASALNLTGYTKLHIDYYSTNASQLRFFLISPGPTETPYILTVPTTSGWNSIDIPLTAFSPVVLSNVIQFKVDNNFAGDGPDVYFDNIYFWK